MTEYRIDLPWSLPPLSMNDRGHWAPKARKVREVREAGCWLARQAKLGRSRKVRFELHYQPAVKRRADGPNLMATQKPLVDGLVDAGVIPDDTAEFLVEAMPTIHEPVKGEPGRMWLVVTVLDESEVA
jgi:crossover junction endodeoxyribonuclease RusA